MNKEKTVQVADKFLNKAMEYLESAEAFASKEVPAYIEELLSFKFFEHLVNALTSISIDVVVVGTLMGVCVFTIVHIVKEEFNYDVSFKKTLLAFPIVYVLAGIGSIASQSNELINAYKAKNAPRVYLVDYFKGDI